MEILKLSYVDINLPQNLVSILAQSKIIAYYNYVPQMKNVFLMFLCFIY